MFLGHCDNMIIIQKISFFTNLRLSLKRILASWASTRCAKNLRIDNVWQDSIDSLSYPPLDEFTIKHSLVRLLYASGAHSMTSVSAFHSAFTRPSSIDQTFDYMCSGSGRR